MPANKLEILIQAKKDIGAIAETNRSLEALRKGLGDASASAQGLQADFSSLGSSVASSLMQIAAATAAIAGSAYLLKSLASSAISAAAGFEQMRISLDTLTKGAGSSTFEELNAWALKMPVNTEKAIQTFIMLRAMGLKPTIQDMTTLVDTTSALGGKADTLQGIARALGQIYTKGKLSAEEMRQLAEQGVPVYEILQQKLKLTAAQLGDIGDQAISGATAVKAILEGLAERFGGQSTKIQNTWSGLTETLVSYWKEFARQVMESGPFDFLRERLKDVVGFLDEAFQTGRFSKWADEVASAILSGFEGLLNALQGVGTAIINLTQFVSDAWNSSFVKKTLEAIDKISEKVRDLNSLIPQGAPQIPTWVQLLSKAAPGMSQAVRILEAFGKTSAQTGEEVKSTTSESSTNFETLRQSIQNAGNSMKEFLNTAKQSLSLRVRGGFAGEVEAGFARQRADLLDTVNANIKAIEAEKEAVKKAVDEEQKKYDQLYKKWQQVRQNQQRDSEKYADTIRDLDLQIALERAKGAEGAAPDYGKMARTMESEYYDRLKLAEEKLAQARREQMEGNTEMARQLAEEATQIGKELPKLMDEAIKYEQQAKAAGQTISGPELNIQDKIIALQEAKDIAQQASEVNKQAWREDAEAAEQAVNKQKALLDPLKELWEDLKRKLEDYKAILASLSEQPAQLEVELRNIDYIKAQLEELSQPREAVLTIRQQVITEQASRWGGLVGAFARGGLLPGWGGGDRIRALLEAGEYVIRKEAVRRYGIALFDALNNMRVRLPALGGLAAPAVPKLAYATGGAVVSQPTRTVRVELGVGGRSFGLMSDEAVAEALERHLSRLAKTTR